MSSNDGSDIGKLINFATQVIRQTGDKALEYYGKGQTYRKFDEELVTQAELDLSEFFQKQLSSHYPNHQLFPLSGDERTYSHEETRYLWIHDPIDGVANFQAGIPIWGTSLALVENYWPVFGVVYMPATGDLFSAQAGDSARWRDQRIEISPLDALDDESLLLTYSRFHQSFKTTFPGKIRSFGCTSAHICYVAMGRADAAVVSNESFQDLAAARIIIESAGGKISRIDGEDFYLNEYLNGGRIEGHLLVCAPKHFESMKNHLQALG